MITSIKKSDITKDYKKLLINGIAVNIPCGLSRDLCAIGMLNARKISISALIRVLHKMIITVMYRMHFKQ